MLLRCVIMSRAIRLTERARGDHHALTCLGAMLAVGENARDTAERDTPARAATSDAVTHGFLSLSFIDS